MSVVLATTVHDPGGRMTEQTARTLPVLRDVFANIAAQATHAASEKTLGLLRDAGAIIRQDTEERFAGYMKLGQPRRDAVALALQSDQPFVMLCDFDRLIHWADCYPDELAAVVARLPEYDFTVLGRTERAFASHPRVQCDTESIINHVFVTTSGQSWDITAAARGLSRRAADAILAGCPDESIGTDASWPLFVQRAGGFEHGLQRHRRAGVRNRRPLRGRSGCGGRPGAVDRAHGRRPAQLGAATGNGAAVSRGNAALCSRTRTRRLT